MRLVALFFLLLGFLLPVQAGQLAIVFNSEDAAHREFLSSFKASIQGSGWQLSWQGNPEAFQKASPGADLLLTLGSTATRAALARTDGPPVLATLLSRNAYELAVAEAPNRRGAVSAIYLDQPLDRQLAFIRKLLPENRRLVLLISAQSRGQLAELRRLTEHGRMELDSEEISSDEALVSVLSRLFAREGVLLALPDSLVYARDNIRPLLLTSYRYQRPVIAFSPAFVQAGALAALHTTPSQLAWQVAQVISSLRSGKPSLPPPQGPSRFSVAINAQVARSLKLTIPGEEEILQSLTSSGGEK